MRYSATQGALAQTFQVTESSPCDAIVVELLRVGSPVGNVWLEIWDATTWPGVAPWPATPANRREALGRTKSQIAGNISTLANSQRRFEMGRRVWLTPGRTYALILNGDYAESTTNYIGWRDDTAPTYPSGAAYYWNGAAWITTGTPADFGFALCRGSWANAELDVAYADAPVQLRNGTSFAVGQGFGVLYDTYAHYLTLWARIPGGFTFAASERWWLEIREDDGSGIWGLPSSTLIAQTHRLPVKAAGQAGGAYLRVAFTLEKPILFETGKRYQITAHGDWTGSVTKYIELAANLTAPWYQLGRLSTSSGDFDAEAWSASTGALCFGVHSDSKPWWLFYASYSDDGIAWTVPAKITDNAATGSGSITFTGQRKRYWRIYSGPCLLPPNTVNEPWTVSLKDYTLDIKAKTEKVLTVTFPAGKVINRVEIYGHPETGGFRLFRPEYSPDGIAWNVLPGLNTETLEARKRGGGAAASWDSVAGEITTDGDYVAMDFGEVTASAVRVRIRSNGQQRFAQVLELRASRTVDVSSRVKEISDARDADALLRRMKARTLDLSLINDDLELSTENTAGTYYGQLGMGVKIIPWIGFQDVPGLVKIGEFYVDDWNEDMGPDVKISARDAVKVMSTTVRASYKVGYRHHQIIEYLANLAGIPSSDMILDQSASIVAYFATQEVDAYEESQKCREGMGLGKMWFDTNGYLRLRALGHTCGSTFEELLPYSINNRSNPVRVGNYLYQATTEGVNGRVGRLDLSNIGAGWTDLGWLNVGTASHGPVWMWEYDGKPYVFTYQQNATPNNLGLWRVDGVGAVVKLADYSNYTLYPAFGGDGTYQPLTAGIIRNLAWASDVVGPGNIIDMLTFELNVVITGGPAGTGYANTGRDLYICHNTAGGTRTGVGLINPEENTFADFIADLDPGFNSIGNGIAWDGDRTLYAAALAWVPGGTPGRSLFNIYAIDRITKVKTLYRAAPGSWAHVISAFQQRPCDAIKYLNGTLFVATQYLWPGTAKPEARLIMVRDGGPAIDATPLHLAAAVLKNLTAFLDVFGDPMIFALGNYSNSIMIRPGEGEALQDTATRVIETETGGSFLDASLNAGDDRGGDSRIVNVCLVKSKPLQPQTAAVLWSAPDLPWSVNTQNRVEFDVQLSEAGVPDATMTAAITGPATVTFKKKRPKQPRIIVEASGNGNITALTISAKPLKATQTLITVVAGPASSLNRQGLRQLSIENDYIYDAFTQSIMAADIVSRAYLPTPNIRGVKARAFWEMETLDRVRIRETTRLKVDRDFTVVRYRRAYLEQVMTLEVSGV
jgi:hypothetical protein